MDKIYHIVGFLVVWGFIIGCIFMCIFYFAGKWFFNKQ